MALRHTRDASISAASGAVAAGERGRRRSGSRHPQGVTVQSAMMQQSAVTQQCVVTVWG